MEPDLTMLIAVLGAAKLIAETGAIRADINAVDCRSLDIEVHSLILFYVKNITYPITPSNVDNSFLSKVVDSLAQTINHLF